MMLSQEDSFLVFGLVRMRVCPEKNGMKDHGSVTAAIELSLGDADTTKLRSIVQRGWRAGSSERGPYNEEPSFLGPGARIPSSDGLALRRAPWAEGPLAALEPELKDAIIAAVDYFKQYPVAITSTRRPDIIRTSKSLV
jgi:hypothetical protein